MKLQLYKCFEIHLQICWQVFVNIPIKNSAKYGPQIIPDSFMAIWNKSKPKVVHNVCWKNIVQV